MKRMFWFSKNSIREEDGVTAIEYGLLAALIALALIAGALLTGTSLNDMFLAIGGFLQGQAGNIPAAP